MKIQTIWKGTAVLLLAVISIAAYNTANPEMHVKDKQCCQKKAVCTETAPPRASGQSIIWDSMSDHLLSTHL